MKKNKSTRNSNFELLRIISIILVIVSHFCIFSGVRELYTDISFNSIIINFFRLGVVANYTFIIITGFFMIDSKIKHKKIIALILEATFYSITIYISILLFNFKKFMVTDLMKSILPIFFGNWFIIYYILLYILIPYINHFIKKINEKEFEKLIIILVLINFFIPTLSANLWEYTYHDFFLTAYLIGAYIRLYGDKYLMRKKIIIKMIVPIISLMILSVIITQLLGYKLNIKFLIDNSDYFIKNTYSIFTIVLAALLVILFRNIKIKNSRIINTISSATLGIYLIHENSFMRRIIWKKIFPVTALYNSRYLLAVMLIKVMAIFSICLIIEILRQLILGNLEEKMSENILKKINSIKKKVGIHYENKKTRTN